MSADGPDWYSDQAQRLLCPAPRSKNVFSQCFRVERTWPCVTPFSQTNLEALSKLGAEKPLFRLLQQSVYCTLEKTESHIFIPSYVS